MATANPDGQTYHLPLNLAAQVNPIPQLPIPPQHHHTPALAPAPIITSTTAPTHPPYRETLDSNQLRAAAAALPPLIPLNRRRRPVSNIYLFIYLYINHKI